MLSKIEGISQRIICGIFMVCGHHGAISAVRRTWGSRSSYAELAIRSHSNSLGLSQGGQPADGKNPGDGFDVAGQGDEHFPCDGRTDELEALALPHCCA